MSLTATMQRLTLLSQQACIIMIITISTLAGTFYKPIIPCCVSNETHKAHKGTTTTFWGEREGSEGISWGWTINKRKTKSKKKKRKEKREERKKEKEKERKKRKVKQRKKNRIR